MGTPWTPEQKAAWKAKVMQSNNKPARGSGGDKPASGKPAWQPCHFDNFIPGLGPRMCKRGKDGKLLPTERGKLRREASDKAFAELAKDMDALSAIEAPSLLQLEQKRKTAMDIMLRAEGAPAQTLTANVNDLSNLTDEQIDERLRQIALRRAAAPGNGEGESGGET